MHLSFASCSSVSSPACPRVGRLSSLPHLGAVEYYLGAAGGEWGDRGPVVERVVAAGDHGACGG